MEPSDEEYVITEKQRKILNGRPPLHGSNEELIELGKELVAWVKERIGKSDLVHLSQFYVNYKNMCRTEWRIIRKRNSFVPYYEQALELMSQQTIINKDINTSYGSRYLGIYCADIRDHERENIVFKAEAENAAKAKEVSNITEEEMEANRAIIRGVERLQELKRKKKETESLSASTNDRTDSQESS